MKIPKFLRLPNAVELGKSKYTSLPMRSIGAKNDDYCWEDWREEVKRDYPIKYFFYKTFAFWFHCNISSRISDFKYWVKSHTIKKYHILDLRNKENNYFYGWRDSDSKMLFALMKIMEDFIIEQDTEKHLIWLKKELIQYPDVEYPWVNLIKSCEELLAIQKWWRVDRQENFKKLDSTDYKDYKDYFEHEQKLYQEDSDMMKKLIDIRQGMWT